MALVRGQARDGCAFRPFTRCSRTRARPALPEEASSKSDQFTFSKRALVSLVSEFINGYPNPDDPQPPGPWDPVIRRALEAMRHRLGPEPDPWRGQMGPHPDPWRAGKLSSLDWVLLNPQPLPPRYAYAASLAEAVAGSVSAYFELDEALPSEMQGRMSEFATMRLSTFIDDCGNGRIPRWPFPWPPPWQGEFDPISPVEMLVVGIAFENLAQSAVNERFRGALQESADRLMNMAAEQMM